MNVTQVMCGLCGHAYRVRVDTDNNGRLVEDPTVEDETYAGVLCSAGSNGAGRQIVAELGPVCISAFLVPGGGGSLELVICDGNGPAFTLLAHPNFELVDRRPT